MTAGTLESPSTDALPKTRPMYAEDYATAQELQRIIIERLKNPKTDSLRVAALATAWDRLAERKRILKMRPKPADMPVDPAALLKALKRAKVRAGGQGSIQRLLKEAEPIIESEPDEPPAHT